MEEIIEQVSQHVSYLELIADHKSVQWVLDTVSSLKQNKSKDTIITGLTELINTLIQEKQELSLALSSFEDEFTNKRITDEQITYISGSLQPIIEKLIPEQLEGEANSQEILEVLRPLISKEFFSIAQFLGFNFKESLGEPLTNLLKSYILSHTEKFESHVESEAIQVKRYELEILKYQVELKKIELETLKHSQSSPLAE